MIDGSEKRNLQLAFELQNSHVCEKRSKYLQFKYKTVSLKISHIIYPFLSSTNFTSQ